MSEPTFQPVEIDQLDEKLAETASRKRMPTMTVTPGNESTSSEPTSMELAINTPAPRKSISLDVPDYLATALKIAAARQSVTVRHLVLNALVDAGFEVHAVDREEDGRRLRSRACFCW